MRILIINTLYRPILPGGAEKSVSLLAEAFVRHGDSVSVVTLHPGPEVSVEILNGVRVHRLPLDNEYWPYSSGARPSRRKRLQWHVKDMWNSNAARRVGAILDEEKPDVVHTNQLEGFSVAVWREIKKRRIRLVHTLRGYYTLCPRSTMFRDGAACVQQCSGCKLFTYNRRVSSKLVDGLISNSGYVLNKHVESGYFGKAGKSVIFNIADLKATTHKAEAPRTRKDLVFGFIGTICPEKGIEMVLEASTRLSYDNWKLNIAGAPSGAYASALKSKFTDPRISWLGFMKADEFFASIDVNIVPSLFPDPLPRTLIETYAAGKSAICAESGGIPEIASLGRMFATYPALNTDALVQRMDDALSAVDQWREGGFQAREGMELFAEATVVDKYRSVYASR